MEAASSEQQQTGNLPRADGAGGEYPQPASSAAPTVSAADLALLRSLTAKIKELMDAESAKVATPVAEAADSAPVQAPSASVTPDIASGGVLPAQRTSSATLTARPEASATAVQPLLDSTQTVRALTPTELADSEASRWFAIELLLSADPIDAAEVPNLDIFGAYRLYSVSSHDQGRLIHALRLGFFSSEVGAQSVARYLAAYFPAPTIRRVSIAEHERFAERIVMAGKDIGASGMHAVIELAGTPAPRPQARSAKAPPTGRKPPRGMAGLLWARQSKSSGDADR